MVRINYSPRPQFVSFHKRTQRFACLVCHRRAGKTVACVHELQRAALRSTLDRPRFAYIGPTYAQAKSVAWDYLLDAAKPIFQFGAKSNTSELRVDYPNGAQVRLFGADNYEALRGLRLDGVVLDEYANFDPRAWPEVISPTLSDRRGFAVFIGTPKGHNNFYDIWVKARDDGDWYSLMLKASETVPLNDRFSEEEAQRRGLLTSEELKRQRDILSEDQFAQEYECSFEAAIIGAYYGKHIERARAEGRITGVPYDPSALVWTSWDLGIRDATAIWFAQVIGREIRLIDYYEATGQDLGHYVREIHSKPFSYAGHIVPHDAQAKELGTGKSRLEVLESLGLKNLRIAPIHRVEDGINGARVVLARSWFDQKKTKRGIEALTLYRSDWNDKLGTLQARPVHDWSSHAADSYRYLAMTLDQAAIRTGFNRKIAYPRRGIV